MMIQKLPVTIKKIPTEANEYIVNGFVNTRCIDIHPLEACISHNQVIGEVLCN